ncbi:MAG: hypothetical protein ABI851_01170 [Saprospiraceae bacterium]
MTTNSHKWYSELIWWFGATLIAILILYPIYYFKIEYPFYRNNVIFILGFFIFFRWVLLWHLTPYARQQWFKLILIFVMLPLVFYFSYEFSDFKNYIDDVGLQELVFNLSPDDQVAMTKYIRTEMLFFSICSLILGILVPPKLIWNIWKQYNLNTV